MTLTSTFDLDLENFTKVLIFETYQLRKLVKICLDIMQGA